jgi:excinuclease ABC subunit A
VILEALCKKYKIPLDIPYAKLTTDAKQKILHGVEDTFEISHVSKFDTGSTHRARYEGVIPNLERRFTENDGTNAMTESTFQKRIAPFVTEIVCPECHGHRLNRESLSVQVGGKNIGELCNLSVESSRVFFRDLKLTKEEQKISVLIFKNIVERLEFLEGVGLSYVTLSRRANTLSG